MLNGWEAFTCILKSRDGTTILPSNRRCSNMASPAHRSLVIEKVQEILSRFCVQWKLEDTESKAAVRLIQVGTPHKQTSHIPERWWVQPWKQICAIVNHWRGLPQAGFGKQPLGSLAAGGSSPGCEYKSQNHKWYLICSKYFTANVKATKLLIS